MQRDDGCSFDEGQLISASARTSEQRRRWRRGDGRLLQRCWRGWSRMMRSMAPLLLTLIALVLAAARSDGCATVCARHLAARTGARDKQSEYSSSPVSIHPCITGCGALWGVPHLRHASVVRTRRGRLHGRRLQLTSAAAAQEGQHASATAYALTLLHSCVHAMRTLTWSDIAALSLCAAGHFEIV